MLTVQRLQPSLFSPISCSSWLAHCEGSKKTRVLNIDGGGTTGIVVGASLIYLEDQILKTGDSKARIIDFFSGLLSLSLHTTRLSPIAVVRLLPSMDFDLVFGLHDCAF
ncbi:hypothetical protein SSX86_030451 [Deinandra increscens subsp. villosa]|uniref:PNPLA domain-containing protein n=1 Tax=Deinandra increscens subsp. villosa TaxID=3103831 RepID=A0AAP0GJN8_9ASTR